MRRFLPAILWLVLAVSIGCGKSTAVNTAPMTDEQKAQIKQEDQEVEDEEKSGAGTAAPGKKRR